MLLLISASLISLPGCWHDDSSRAIAPRHAQSGAVKSRVLRVGFTVSNLERALRAFAQLDFKVEKQYQPSDASLSLLYGVPSARARVAQVMLGSETVELTECTAYRGRPVPADSRSNDAWFQHLAIVVRDMDAAYARLFTAPESDRLFSPISPAPQTIPASNPNAGGIRALYFRDSDGHNLELIWFPPGKGRSVWHTPGSDIFLGIDHSAIASADAQRDRTAYAALGFSVAGASLNFGAEQEALSGVPGARVAITTLRDDRGPGVELLNYLNPRNGRLALAGTSPCDLWHWEITIAVSDLEHALTILREYGIEPFSPAIASFNDDALGYRRAVLVRDPDGHALRLVEQ